MHFTCQKFSPLSSCSGDSSQRIPLAIVCIGFSARQAQARNASDPAPSGPERARASRFYPHRFRNRISLTRRGHQATPVSRIRSEKASGTAFPHLRPRQQLPFVCANLRTVAANRPRSCPEHPPSIAPLGPSGPDGVRPARPSGMPQAIIASSRRTADVSSPSR